MPEALFYSRMTFKVHLKELLAGKLPYCCYTTLIYARGKKRANKGTPDLEKSNNRTCFKGQLKRKLLIAQWLSVGGLVYWMLLKSSVDSAMLSHLGG